MRRLSLLALVLTMGVAMDAAKAGPDPPAGKYGIGIRLNDGTWPEVPVGEPVIFPAWKDGVLGMEIHGWVNLPNPGGDGYRWGVRFDGILQDGDFPTSTVPFQFGPHAWTGKINQGHWSMWVTAGFNFNDLGLPSYHEYLASFSLVINGPDIGQWWPASSCTAWGCW